MKILWHFLLFALPLFASQTEVLSYAYYLDEAHTLSAEDAYAQKENFSALTKENESLGFQDITVWLYVKVKNNSNKTSTNLAVFPYAQLDNITVYKYTDEKIEKSYTTGDLQDFNTREIDNYRVTIPYSIEANSSKEMMFKIVSNSSLNIGLKFYTQEEYYGDKAKGELFLGGYYGIIVIIILYNFVLYFMLREVMYFDYVAFHLAYFVLHFTMNGLSFQYFYPHMPELNLYMVPIWFILANIFAVRFTVTYLSLGKYVPKVMPYVYGYMFAYGLLLVGVFFLPYALVAKTMTLMAFFSAPFILGFGVYVWYKYGTRNSKVFTIGWGFLYLGAMFTTAQNLGYIPMDEFTNYAAQLGTLFELSLLSLNLAYGYNVLYKKLQVNEKSLLSLSSSLEEKVDLRTEELKLQIENKNILFKELYHRVKNNLQMISSLLHLQSGKTKDDASKEALVEMTNRINSISLIHEKLYSTEDLARIDMQEYVEVLVKELAFGLESQGITFEVDCAEVRLNLEMSVPLGLIINELVTNAIKYAFTSEMKDKKIHINMQETKHNTFSLEVLDNGKGADMEALKEGFGFMLIESLVVYKLQGNIESSSDTGVQHKMTFEGEET